MVLLEGVNFYFYFPSKTRQRADLFWPSNSERDPRSGGHILPTADLQEISPDSPDCPWIGVIQSQEIRTGAFEAAAVATVQIARMPSRHRRPPDLAVWTPSEEQTNLAWTNK